jgi:hypothetical protein
MTALETGKKECLEVRESECSVWQKTTIDTETNKTEATEERPYIKSLHSKSGMAEMVEYELRMQYTQVWLDPGIPIEHWSGTGFRPADLYGSILIKL